MGATESKPRNPASDDTVGCITASTCPKRFGRTHYGYTHGMSEFLGLIDWLRSLLFFVATAAGGVIIGAFYTHWTHRGESDVEGEP